MLLLRSQKLVRPGLTPLSQPMPCVQVHAVGDVLHGPQLEKEAQIHQRQNQQAKREGQYGVKPDQWREGRVYHKQSRMHIFFL